jgi:nucleotide sugar dehydrogenase
MTHARALTTRAARPPARPDAPSTATTAVVGLGYVGLPTALSLAGNGPVIGIDTSKARLDAIRDGRVDLLPADHARLDRLRHHHDADSDNPTDAAEPLRLTHAPAALRDAEVVLVCVPTPVDDHLGPDLTALRAACETVVANARPGQTIILTSTTYVGCTRELLVEPLAARGLRAGAELCVAFSPERIDPANDRVPQDQVPRVVGGVTDECTDRAAAALQHIAANIHCVSSPEAAELTKLLENTFRAVNIALANEFADLASTLGVEVGEVIEAASTKPYGFMPFWPGPGVGGHCIPCDPHYLLWQLQAARHPAPIIRDAMEAIAVRPQRVVSRVVQLLADRGRPVLRSRVLVVGVAYKAGVEDVRESPALEILSLLRARGADVAYTDALVPSITVGGERMDAVDAEASDADLVVVHTVHPDVDHSWLRSGPPVLDTTYRLQDVPGSVAL